MLEQDEGKKKVYIQVDPLSINFQFNLNRMFMRTIYVNFVLIRIKTFLVKLTRFGGDIVVG